MCSYLQNRVLLIWHDRNRASKLPEVSSFSVTGSILYPQVQIPTCRAITKKAKIKIRHRTASRKPVEIAMFVEMERKRRVF